MRVRIHRGAAEIGGNCVEIESAGARIVLDVGRPLAAERHEIVPLPAIEGFETPDASLLGVIISHAHQDHWGLAPQLPPDTPIFVGEAASRILKEAAFFTSGLDVQPAGFLEHRRTFTIGPFEVTPYLNDHSAFDAYSLLIEAEGKRLFYSADLQGHGRKKGIFQELLRDPPTNIDAMLMEGTHIQAAGTDPRPETTEIDVEEACVTTMRSTEGLVVAVYSAQNIDRLVTLYRAALRSGRSFVIDLYGASVADATGKPSIPRPHEDWPKVKVYVPQNQRIKVKESQEFDRVEAIKPYRIFPEEICSEPSRYVLTFRGSMAYENHWDKCLEGARAIWSLWPGYMSSSDRTLKYFSSNEVPVVIHHASGHATVDQLRRLAAAVAPTRLVPIHSAAPERFREIFSNVDQHEDGEWWDV